jgi:hypothetical protein
MTPAERAAARERWEAALKQTSADCVEGYSDGFHTDAVPPGSNRSPCYQHGFEVGRADREKRAAFGSATGARAAWQSAVTEQMNLVLGE